ncbi:hypothetical protein [Thiohalobacter thiocyanaticus]|uniref:Uncharacterized protein n=1 Tax=Thiohalobacter thiocyanaticus TaxID=585455 RepID=A0A426QLE5_9GAMM|nr:hypothetical protein [Thiohalobacter thiocyanaticus]RRQ22585.1 hypothetical protein D6C00_12000 [Thiohalobacter thiocyanaticus]
MQLRYLQSLLEQLYEIDIGLDVEDFLITDRRLAALLDRSPRPRDIPEKLLIEQSGEDVDVFPSTCTRSSWSACAPRIRCTRCIAAT